MVLIYIHRRDAQYLHRIDPDDDDTDEEYIASDDVDQRDPNNYKLDYIPGTKQKVGIFLLVLWSPLGIFTVGRPISEKPMNEQNNLTKWIEFRHKKPFKTRSLYIIKEKFSEHYNLKVDSRIPQALKNPSIRETGQRLGIDHIYMTNHLGKIVGMHLLCFDIILESLYYHNIQLTSYLGFAYSDQTLPNLAAVHAYKGGKSNWSHGIKNIWNKFPFPQETLKHLNCIMWKEKIVLDDSQIKKCELKHSAAGMPTPIRIHPNDWPIIVQTLHATGRKLRHFLHIKKWDYSQPVFSPGKSQFLLMWN